MSKESKTLTLSVLQNLNLQNMLVFKHKETDKSYFLVAISLKSEVEDI